MSAGTAKILLALLLLLAIAQPAAAYTVDSNVTQTLTRLPILNAQIDVNTLGLGGVLVGSCFTDVSGKCSVTIADSNVYKITATYNGASSATIKNITGDIDVNFALAVPTVTLSGIVTNLNGDLLDGVNISVKVGAVPAIPFATTVAGAYSVSVFDATNYNVTATALAPYISSTQAVTTAGATTLDFTLCRDADGDGFVEAGVGCGGTDCDDTNPAINPGAADVCNGVDDDCDASTADGSGEAALLNTNQTGACALSTQACTAGAWADDYTGVAGYEAVDELSCDTVDNDCDGTADEGVLVTYYQDSDTDTYGNAAVSQQACAAPVGYVTSNTDCDDTNPAINPGAVEVCGDGIDNDCAGGDAACAPPAAPEAAAAPSGGGGGGGGGGTRGDAECKPAPVGLGIGVSGWLCAADTQCTGISWGAIHPAFDGQICCNIICVAAPALEALPPEEQGAEEGQASEEEKSCNVMCKDSNPCTADSCVEGTCNYNYAAAGTACYLNGAKGSCGSGICNVEAALQPGAQQTAAAGAPTGFFGLGTPTGFAGLGIAGDVVAVAILVAVVGYGALYFRKLIR